MTKKRTKMSDQVRAFVLSSEKTRYRICKETGIDQGALSRFVHGQCGLSMDSLDRLAESVGLTVTLATAADAKKPRSSKRKGR